MSTPDLTPGQRPETNDQPAATKSKRLVLWIVVVLGIPVAGLFLIGVFAPDPRSSEQPDGEVPFVPGRVIWSASGGTSQMDGSEWISLTATSVDEIEGWLKRARPELVLTCSGNTTFVSVETGVPPEPETGLFNEATVRYRIGESPPVTEVWDVSTNRETLLARRSIPLIRSMAKADSFLFEFTAFNAGARQMRFETTGLAKRVEELSNLCGWKL